MIIPFTPHLLLSSPPRRTPSAPVARRMSELSTGAGCILGLVAAALKTAVLPHQDHPVGPLLFLVSWSLQSSCPSSHLVISSHSSFRALLAAGLEALSTLFVKVTTAYISYGSSCLAT